VCEQLSLHKQLYGESILQTKNSAANCIIESCEVLELQEQNTRVVTQPHQKDAELDVEAQPQQLSLPSTTAAAAAAAADSNSSVSPVRSSFAY